MTTIVLLLICLRVGAQTDRVINYSQHESVQKAKIDSTIFARIPYSSEKAKQDTLNRNIQIISLRPGSSPWHLMDEMIVVEERFGFRFIYDYYKYPRNYLERVESEYNSIMYQYLDSANRIDSKKQIWLELARMYYERQYYSSKTDKELSKKIRKKLKGESKEIKMQILDADILYRDRKFVEALTDYERISMLSLKSKTEVYLVNSKYHCLINLKRYEEADSLKEINYDINLVIKL